MWSALSWQEQMGQLRLLDWLKRTAYFWLQVVPDRYLKQGEHCPFFPVRDARLRQKGITDFAVSNLILI